LSKIESAFVKIESSKPQGCLYLCGFSFFVMIQNLSRFFSQKVFVATGITFGINALLFTFWVIRLPEVKVRLGMSEGELGLVLFCMPVGALLAMVLSNRLTHRFGAGRVTVWSTVAFCLGMLLPLQMPSIWSLGLVLFFIGIFTGTMDIAMNAVAATLEVQYKKIIMSTCHGFFSLGGMVGAGLTSLLIGWQVVAMHQMWVGVALALLVALLWIRPLIYPVKEHNTEHGGGWAWPTKALLGLAIIAFCSMQGEGTIADWSTIFLKEVASAGEFMLGLGYFGFSLSMTLGRFWGDSIIERAGPRQVVMISGFLVILGLLLVIPAWPWVSILGFTLAGAGYALLIPILFSESAKAPGVSPAKGIASVATMGYLGFLIGPTIIGGIAEQWNLQISFTYLVGLTVLALGLGLGKVRQ
jgi:MFS family permease